MARVLVIGDLHLPAEREDYLEFCKGLKRKYRTNTTVFIGDVIDHHSISFHDKYPDSPNAVVEHSQVMFAMDDWKKAFKEAMVCIGNHDERVHRLASASGIPSMYLKEYQTVYNTPNWDWAYEFEIDGVYYTHGTSTSGIRPAMIIAMSRLQSTVSGHVHSVGCINTTIGPTDNLIFGFNVPNGVDRHHKLMYYGRNFLKKPVNGAGVVIDGKPYMEIMNDK
jgi:predicted phosphodiesterase